MKRSLLLCLFCILLTRAGFAQYLDISHSEMVAGDEFITELDPHAFPAAIFLLVDIREGNDGSVEEWISTVELDGIIVAELRLSASATPGVYTETFTFPDADDLVPYNGGTALHFCRGAGGAGTYFMRTIMFD